MSGKIAGVVLWSAVSCISKIITAGAKRFSLMQNKEKKMKKMNTVAALAVAAVLSGFGGCSGPWDRGRGVGCAGSE